MTASQHNALVVFFELLVWFYLNFYDDQPRNHHFDPRRFGG